MPSLIEITPELSETLGIFAADGSMQEEHICMWGNISEDKEYYDHILCPLFSRVFNKEVVAHEKKSNSVYGFYLCDKKIIALLKEFGFCRKKTYTVQIPELVLKSNNPKVLSAFIRGFADCDGYISFLRRKGKYCEFKRRFHTYPRIGIKIASKQMINGLSSLLKQLNIPHTLYIEKARSSNLSDIHTIEIRGKERVEQYMLRVGFHNPSQYSKYLIWKKFGFCPVKTSIEQRQLILSNKLDPYSFYAPDRP